MALVMDVCDYIYVLDFGRLIFEGTAAGSPPAPTSRPPTSARRPAHIAELEAEHDRHEHEGVGS